MLLPTSVKLVLHSRVSRLLYDAVVAYLLFSRALASILHRQEPDDGVYPPGTLARIWGPRSFKSFDQFGRR